MFKNDRRRVSSEKFTLVTKNVFLTLSFDFSKHLMDNMKQKQTEKKLIKLC